MTQPIQPHGRNPIIPDLSRLNLLRGAGERRAGETGAGGELKARDGADVSASLAKVKSLLAELDQASSILAKEGDGSADARRRVDEIIASIDAVVAGAKPGAAGGGGPGYTVEDVNEGVRKFSIGDVQFGPSGSVDVNVVITQSAQQAGYFLSFGGTGLDLSAATAQFGIEISGPRGSIPLTFASGTAVSDFAAAVNSFTDQTGVIAVPSGTGVRLESTGFGAKEFVSVRVLEDGGLNQAAAGAGVYQLAASNATIASAATRVSFDSESVSDGLTDYGQHVAGTINGTRAKGDGFFLTVQSPILQARIALRTGEGLVNAQNLGAMTAFTIVQNEGSAGSSLARDVRGSLGL